MRRFIYPLLFALTLFVSDSAFAQRSTFFFTTVHQTEVTFDADYQAVLTHATGQGYTLPSSAQQALQNQLVLDLKAAGIWSELDVFYVFATDGDSDFATLNWKDPTQFQCSKVNSPTFTANEGFRSNTTTSYLNSNWNALTDGVNYTQDDASFGYYSNTDNSLNNQNDVGIFNTATNDGAVSNARNTGGFFTYRINSTSGLQQAISPPSTGLHHIERTGVNAQAVYKNGALLHSGAGPSAVLTSTTFYICAYHTINGGQAAGFSPRNLGCVWFGASLIGLEATFYTAWNTYFTQL